LNKLLYCDKNVRIINLSLLTNGVNIIE